jgi:hypothetical protein
MRENQGKPKKRCFFPMSWFPRTWVNQPKMVAETSKHWVQALGFSKEHLERNGE